MMTPIAKDYFERLEPLVQRLTVLDNAITVNFSDLGEVDGKTLIQFARLIQAPQGQSMHDALDELWQTFNGTGINYLIDRPKYNSFLITLTDDRAYVSIVTENCGRYEEIFVLDGKAQRFEFCHILGSMHVGMPIQQYSLTNFRFEYDGHNLKVNQI